MLAEHVVDWAADRFAARLAPPPAPPGLLAWASTLKLRPETRGQPKPYDPAAHPPQYFALLALERIIDRRWPYRRVVYAKPTQDGGTIITQSIPQLYVAGVRGEPVVAGLPDRELAGIQWRGKTRPLLVDGGLAGWLPQDGPGSDGSGTPSEVALAGTPLYWVGAGASNEAGQAMRTGRLLTRDEYDAIDLWLAELMTGRLDAYPDTSIIIDTSTIKHDVGSPILAALKGSTNGHMEYACLACQAWVEWRWRHVELDMDSEHAAIATVRLRCPHCKALIDDIERRERMLVLGNARLAGPGWWLGADGEVHGTIPAKLTWGMLWRAIDSPRQPLAELARLYWGAYDHLRRTRDHAQLRRFWRDRETDVYEAEEISDEISAKALAKRAERSDYRKREAPPWVSYITVGQDCQGDRHYWLAVGFASDWSRAAIIDWGYEYLVPGTLEDGSPAPDRDRPPTDPDRYRVLATIDARMAHGWGVAGDDQRRLIPSRCGCDVGYQERVLVPWLQANRSRWSSCKGVGRDQSAKMDKTAIRGGKSILPPLLAERLLGYVDVRQPDTMPIPLVNVNGHTVRLQLQQALMLGPAEVGGCWLPAGTKSNDYLLLHLSSEVWTELIEDGRPTGKWYWHEARPSQNHLLDCATYAWAMAIYHREVSALAAVGDAAPPPPRQPPPPDDFRLPRNARQHSRLFRRS